MRDDEDQSGLLTPDAEQLRKLIDWVMPFGRYEGTRLIDLPEPYVVWLRGNAELSPGLAQAIGLLYEVKANGLEPMVRKTAQAFIDLDDA